MSINLTATETGAENTRNVFSGTNINTSKVYTGKSNFEDFTPDDSVNVYVGVFFDGTANNRDNTNSRLAYESIEARKKQSKGETLTAKEIKAANSYKGTKQEKDAAKAYEGWLWGTKSGSYDNDKSNIARMETFYNDKTTDKVIQTHVYIEGAGTKSGSKDSVFGLGLGTGSTGVRAKVKKACKEIASAVKKAAGDIDVNKLIIDVYGFSRGAAQARNFVFEISQKEGDIEDVISYGEGETIIIKFKQDYGLLGKHLAQKGIEMKSKLDIRFAGLYDTVLALGLGFEHENNVKRLKMVAVNKARFVFHLAAANEHRKNFKLTNIKSSRGLEKTIPGVHSDVGGGYVDKAKDNVILKRGYDHKAMEKEQANLIKEGWYKKSQIPIKTFYGNHMVSYELEGNKEKVSNKYSFIPLQIMAKFSVDKKVDILESKVVRKFSINGIQTLMDAKTQIDNYVNGSRGRFEFDNDKDRELIKTLRNEYFHWSANLGSIGMGPNIENGKRVRKIFPG